MIAPNVVIRASNHALKRESLMRFQPHTYGEIIIEDDVWISSNAVITSGVILAKGKIVEAGAVVTKSTEVLQYSWWFACKEDW
jgi:galactoside O-acetyltransferase